MKKHKLKVLSNCKGMELMQAMGLMVICLVLAGAVYLAASNNMTDQMEATGNALTSIYDYASVIDDAEEEGDGAEVTPVDKVAMAYDSQRLGGQIASYYGTKAEVDAAQETANEAMELAIEANNTASETQATLASKADLLQGGTEIGANANLNSYTTIGNYYCTANATATTISNTPIANIAFTLKVEDAVGNSATTTYQYRRQIFYPFNITEDVFPYCRTLTSSNGGASWSYGEWVPFSGGGGVTKSKLAAATATEADVWKGKTFYAGDKEIKTGTLSGVGVSCHVRANTGTTHTKKSSTVYLPAGTYTYDGLSTMYTYPNNGYGCRFKIFVNGTQKVNGGGASTWSEFLGNLYIITAGASGTLTLTEASNVYLQIEMTLSSTYPSLSQSSFILTKTS